MSDRWYYTNRGAKSGPHSSRQLKDLADADRILPTDTVWKEGTAKGVPARKVKNLFTKAPVDADLVAVAAIPAALGVAALVNTVILTDLHPAAPTAAATVVAETASAIRASELAPAPVEPCAGEASTSGDVGDAVPPVAQVKPPAKFSPPVSQPGPLAVRKGRATAGRGAIIVGQDGTTVKFRKRCVACGYQDTCSALSHENLIVT